MVTRIAIIILLVLVLAFLIHLSIQVKKGKTIVFVFGKLNLSELTSKLPSSVVTSPVLIEKSQVLDNTILGGKAVGFLQGITH